MMQRVNYRGMAWEQFAAQLRWTCHGCDDERPDRLISVMSTSFEAVGGVPIGLNLRYCNDRPACAALVNEKLNTLAASLATGTSTRLKASQ